MTMRWVVKTAAVLLVGLSALPALAGFHGYISIKGSKQGEFKGESPKAAHRGKIELVSLKLEPATRLNDGKLHHRALVITKERGAASPQLEQAASTNEVLSEVKIEFDSPEAKGEKPTAVETVLLRNATIASRRVVGTTEVITLTYQRILVTHRDGSTTTADDWEVPDV